MNTKRAATLFIIAFFIVEALLAFQVEAVGGAQIVQTKSSGACASPCTVTFTTATSPNNVIVIAISMPQFTPITVNTPTDSQGNIFTQVVIQTQFNNVANPATNVIYQTTAGGNTADAVTFTSTGGLNAVVTIFELTGVTTASLCFSSGSSAFTGNTNTMNTGTGISSGAPSCAVSGPYIAIAAGTSLGGGTVSAGTGFTAVNVPAATGQGIEDAASSATVANPTTFPMPYSGGAAAYDEVGVVYSGSAQTQTQTIGSCPGKNTATLTMVNATVYFYAGTSLGQEVTVSAQSFLASITGSVSQTLYLSIYVTPAAGSVSVSNPLTRIGYNAFVISPSTKNTAINWNTALTPMVAGATWAVGVSGDNKLVLNQSSTSGVTSQTFTGGFIGGAGFFTSLGSAATNLYLCATGNYQSIITSTTTTTAPATSTVFTTSTSTVLTVGTGLLTSASNLPVIFLILLLPAGLFLGITKNLAGGLVGLLIGSVIGELMGVLPIWAFTGLVIALVALAFVARSRDN